MKKRIYLLFIFISLISVVWFAQLSKAKYRERSEINLSITSTPLYFDHTGTNITLLYDNNINMALTVHNYVDKDYTIENINYTVSISNSNYTFSIDGVSATNNKVPLVIQGGARNSDTLNIVFKRIATSEVPFAETIDVTVSADYPYTFSKSFTVRIVNSEIEVQGNPINWTNKDVTLKVFPTLETTFTEYSFDGGATWSTNNSKVYTQNTNNIVVYAKNSKGSTFGPLEIDITKIDKTAPEFTIENDIEYNSDGSAKTVQTLIATLNESKDILTGINATDTQSGITSGGIQCYRNGKQITSTSEFTSVGRYQVTYIVKDEAGNVSTIKRDILIRWPLAGKYVLARQSPIGTGLGSESTGMGLYADDATTGKDTSLPYTSKYYYSGKTVDNYLNFPNTSRDGTSTTNWRILSVAENDTVKIVYYQGLSDQYNINSKSTSNDNFYTTAIYENLNSWVSSGNVGKNSNDIHINFSDSGHIDTGTFYVGAIDRRGTNASDSSTLREVTDERTNTNFIGSNSPAWQSKLGMLTVTDYTKASNSANVFSIRSIQINQSSFVNTCWLHTGKTEWTMNASITTSRGQFWRVDDNEILSHLTSNLSIYRGYIRPVVFLKNTTILSGTGNNQDPFVVQEHWGWFDPIQTLQTDNYDYSNM